MVKARGLKKKDLAQAMGISPQAVSTRLQGTANWTLDEACAAADFLRVPLDTLLRASLTAGEVLGYSSVETTQIYVAMPDSRLRVGLDAVTLAG